MRTEIDKKFKKNENECRSKSPQFYHERTKEDSNTYRTLIPEKDALYKEKKLPNRSVDLGSAPGSIGNLLNITPFEKKVKRKFAGKTMESSVFKPVDSIPKRVHHEKLNKSFQGSAGVIYRNKFDELKNFYTEKVYIEHNMNNHREDYYLKKKPQFANSIENFHMTSLKNSPFREYAHSSRPENDVEINYKSGTLKKYQNRLASSYSTKVQSRDNLVFGRTGNF